MLTAVVEAGTIARAAEALGLSSSGVSRALSRLEQRVGVRLLHRNTRNVSLTEAGDRLLQRVRPAVEELSAAIGQTSHLREQPIGWDPDLNDGVRLNIRPFINAGVLRSTVNVHWKKDRGKNPDGSERHNDIHRTLAAKRAAGKNR